MGTAAEIISFDKVGRSFAQKGGELVATRDISVRIGEGEIVTIVGPSGCGKTTMLNLVAGLLKPSTGTVLYRGAPITAINGRTGYMTQSDHLLPWRDVASNIAVPLEIRDMPRSQRRERVAELIALVGLKHFETVYPSRLSGGMKKRAALARLLAYDPETLLLDEPFAALDEITRWRLNDELLDLWRSEGLAIVFVTHSVYESAYLATRIVVLSARPGRIVGEIAFDAPLPRGAEYRASAAYLRTCQAVSARLAEALGGSGEP